MIDREKIIKGIEYCLQYDRTGKECIRCPYSEECGTDAEPLLKDMLAYMKAQEPHVLTLEEMFELRFDDVVYFEALRTNFVIGGIIIDVIPRMPNGKIGLVQFRHPQEPLNNADLEFYGKTWRCWSARPTDEQREAVKWDD